MDKNHKDKGQEKHNYLSKVSELQHVNKREIGVTNREIPRSYCTHIRAGP